MAEYLRPDVYVEEISSGEKPIQSVSTSTGAMIGITARGQVGVPVLVTSWTDFVNKFSGGLSTPFLKNSDLPNAVYGFFQNGGSRLYIVRVASESSVEAKCETVSEGLQLIAKDSGAWANNTLKVEIKAGLNETFKLNVYMKNELVEVFEDLSNDKASINHFIDVINETSKYIKVDPSTEEVLADTSGIKDFVGGDDNFVGIASKDYTGAKGLLALDLVNDVNLIAIPGQTEKEVLNALLSYVDQRGNCFAILDSPKGADVEAVKTHREGLTGVNGAYYYPWGRIIDPLGLNSKSLKSCPPSGHIMGVYARVDSNRGVYKAPAGEECIVRGFADLETVISNGSVDILNPLGINTIISKPNKGILVWGARTLSNDINKRYVSDIRYDIMVKTSLYEGTQWAIFEPNNESLWEKVDTSIRSFLDLQWRSGALRGTSSEEAYYVKCDSELNSEDSIDNGMLVAEVGYAKQKPAEFVVIRIVQKQNS